MIAGKVFSSCAKFQRARRRMGKRARRGGVFFESAPDRRIVSWKATTGPARQLCEGKTRKQVPLFRRLSDLIGQHEARSCSKNFEAPGMKVHGIPNLTTTRMRDAFCASLFHRQQNTTTGSSRARHPWAGTCEPFPPKNAFA